VTNFPEVSSSEKRRTLRFRVRNTSNQAKLFSYGHKPVMLELSHKEYLAVTKGQSPVFSKKWQRLTTEVNYRKCDEGLAASFEYTLGEKVLKNDHIMFAYA